MKKSTVYYFLFAFIAFTSCSKEKFPENKDLENTTWIEQTNDSFKSKLLISGEILYLYKPGTIDTLNYRLDKKQGLIYFSLANYPGTGESSCKISIDRKKKKLSIWNLFTSIPEKSEVSVFDKQ